MKFLLFVLAILCSSKAYIAPSFIRGNMVMIQSSKSASTRTGTSVLKAAESWQSQLKVLRTDKRARIVRLMNKATNLFPDWVIGASLTGFAKPSLFNWFRPLNLTQLLR